jgi:hypothetical protein
MNKGLSTYAPLHETAQWRMKAICDGQEDAEVAPCSGMPVTTTDRRHVENIHAMLKENHSTTCKANHSRSGNIHNKCVSRSH